MQLGWNLMFIAEIMDFGYPQNLSPEILKLYITQEGVRSPFSSKVRTYTFIHIAIYVFFHRFVFGLPSREDSCEIWCVIV